MLPIGVLACRTRLSASGANRPPSVSHRCTRMCWRRLLQPSTARSMASCKQPDLLRFAPLAHGAAATTPLQENVDMMSEYIGLDKFKAIYVVDLCHSLCEQAKAKVQAKGWKNVHIIEGDACEFTPPEGTAHLITFSYSLSSECQARSHPGCLPGKLLCACLLSDAGSCCTRHPVVVASTQHPGVPTESTHLHAIARGTL